MHSTVLVTAVRFDERASRAVVGSRHSVPRHRRDDAAHGREPVAGRVRRARRDRPTSRCRDRQKYLTVLICNCKNAAYYPVSSASWCTGAALGGGTRSGKIFPRRRMHSVCATGLASRESPAPASGAGSFAFRIA